MYLGSWRAVEIMYWDGAKPNKSPQYFGIATSASIQDCVPLHLSTKENHPQKVLAPHLAQTRTKPQYTITDQSKSHQVTFTTPAQPGTTTSPPGPQQHQITETTTALNRPNEPKSESPTNSRTRTTIIQQPNQSSITPPTINPSNQHPSATKPSDHHQSQIEDGISEKERMKAMEKASNLLGKSFNIIHKSTHPKSTDSWLMHKIKTIISTTDKVINPHRYRFENDRNAAKYNT